MVAASLLLARRRWPLVVLGGDFVLFIAYHHVRYPGGAPSPALWVARYSAAASPRRRTVVLSLIALLILFGDLEARTTLEGVPPLATGLDSSTVVLVAMLLLGEVVHSRRALLRRVAAERLRIARELHDVVARTVAVISVQAGVTRRLIAAFVAQPGRQPVAPERLAPLTDREREVMALVAEGLTNEDIAERLVLSPATVRTHVHRAMGKLNARDRAQLVVLAYQTGLVSGSGGARGNSPSGPPVGRPSP